MAQTPQHDGKRPMKDGAGKKPQKKKKKTPSIKNQLRSNERALRKVCVRVFAIL